MGSLKAVKNNNALKQLMQTFGCAICVLYICIHYNQQKE